MIVSALVAFGHGYSEYDINHFNQALDFFKNGQAMTKRGGTTGAGGYWPLEDASRGISSPTLHIPIYTVHWYTDTSQFWLLLPVNYSKTELICCKHCYIRLWSIWFNYLLACSQVRASTAQYRNILLISHEISRDPLKFHGEASSPNTLDSCSFKMPIFHKRRIPIK